ncbi:MAG: 50S ribosomal protein L5 [Candidatus Pacearchaeota archaeon]|nr:50S ribosomal protein L5 [Candidatus Pacearchaeota archaeon]
MKENMRKISIESITLHCSTADPNKLEKAVKLLKFITKATPVKTLAKKRIPAFKIRPGLPIGCKVTIRKNTAELLRALLAGVPKLKEKQFNPGFLSFGIKEYIEIPSLPYQREIGIMGFDVVVKLSRPGYRVEKRRRAKSKIGRRHRITKEETIEYFKNNFKVNIEK